VQRLVLPHVLIRHDFRPRSPPGVNGQNERAQKMLFSPVVSLHGVCAQAHLRESILSHRRIVAGRVRTQPSSFHHPPKLGVLLEKFGANLA